MNCPKCGSGNARFKDKKVRTKAGFGVRLHKRPTEIIVCKKCGEV